MVWTPERRTMLQKLVADGVRFEEVGERLGVSKNAAVSAAWRFRFTRRENALRTKWQVFREKDAATLALLHHFAQPSVATFPLRGCLFGHGHPERIRI